MPTASVVVPAFNSEKTLPETLDALLSQTCRNFEVIIVNDGSTDGTLTVARGYASDARVRIVSQSNRGLAGARNAGIHAARGDFIGFCDADDIWMPEKLAAHVHHLETAQTVGLSFAGSRLIDEASRPTGVNQRPKLRKISAADVLRRNPVGNGSAAVIRRAALRDIAQRPWFEKSHDWVFDETFRQSEDIECWMRLLLCTDWEIEGVPGLLTGYRISSGGLSAATERQLMSWERMVTKLRPYSPAFFARHENAARAYQLRYLARRAVSSLDGGTAWDMVVKSMVCSRHPLIHEPAKTATTLCAAGLLRVCGETPVKHLRNLIAKRAIS
ncbi:MAG: glycosyltransferase family 2 protein [Paracoccaceae bacterium]|nr:glycosyltransferase family 2 protein [Paracoccaceae bacterium]